MQRLVHMNRNLHVFSSLCGSTVLLNFVCVCVCACSGGVQRQGIDRHSAFQLCPSCQYISEHQNAQEDSGTSLGRLLHRLWPNRIQDFHGEDFFFSCGSFTLDFTFWEALLVEWLIISLVISDAHVYHVGSGAVACFFSAGPSSGTWARTKQFKDAAWGLM